MIESPERIDSALNQSLDVVFVGQIARYPEYLTRSLRPNLLRCCFESLTVTPVNHDVRTLAGERGR